MYTYECEEVVMGVEVTIRGEISGATRNRPPTDVEVTDILVRGHSILPVASDHLLDVSETLFMEFAADMWRADQEAYWESVAEDRMLESSYN